MRYAILSDVHANLPALEAVLRDADAQSCETFLCLGDLVGYNDHPSECVQLIRTRCPAVTKGNFDEYCGLPAISLQGFNPKAEEKIEWTRAQFSPEDRTWLGKLPYVKHIDDFTIVHATLDEPKRWGYIFEKLAAAAHFAYQDRFLCFFGHTHIPVAFEMQRGLVSGGTYSKFILKPEKQLLGPGKKYLVNVGSVGQPRDGNPLAAYVVYDSTTRTVELRRIDYPRGSSGGEGKTVPSGGGGEPPKTLAAQRKFET